MSLKTRYENKSIYHSYSLLDEIIEKKQAYFNGNDSNILIDCIISSPNWTSFGWNYLSSLTRTNNCGICTEINLHQNNIYVYVASTRLYHSSLYISLTYHCLLSVVFSFGPLPSLIYTSPHPVYTHTFSLAWRYTHSVYWSDWLFRKL